MSKQKGNQGERELARHLGDIFGGKFVRVMTSGAFVGGKNAVRKVGMGQTQLAAMKGDLIVPDFMPKLVVECKFYKSFNFHMLLKPEPCKQLDTWIKQALDTNDPTDIWFVCFKINLRGWYVCVPKQQSSNYVFKNHCVYSGEHGEYFVTDLLDFFSTNRDTILSQTA